MSNGTRTAAGLAIALESACLLQSPETAAELERLRKPLVAAPGGLPTEQRAALAEQLRGTRPATDELVAQIGKSIADQAAHEHPTWED
ncbi:hypothetical protein ACF1CG_38140, partial [Streptomyces sp. NPDC014773]